MPVRHFLVLFWGGEGSTFLVDSLSRLAPIHVPGLEPLEHHRPWMRDVGVARKLAWLDRLFQMPAGGERAVWHEDLRTLIPGMGSDLAPPAEGAQICGIKVRPSVFLHHSHASSGRFSLGAVLRWIKGRVKVPAWISGLALRVPRAAGFSGLEDLLVKHDVHVLFLRREDLLRQALSMYRMNRQGHSQFSDRRGPTHVDPKLLLRHLRDYENARTVSAALKSAFDRRAISWSEMVYEDLAADPAAAIHGFTQAIGLDLERPVIAAMLHEQQRFAKTGGGDWADLVLNAGEVSDKLRGTKYARYLGPSQGTA